MIRASTLKIFVWSIILIPVIGGAQTATIGVTLPLTGNLAELGSEVRRGIQLAEKEQGPNPGVVFQFEDDRYDPVQTVSAIRKLLSTKNPKAFIVLGAGPSLAVGPILEQAQVPTVSLSVVKDLTKGRRFIFRHWLDSDVESNMIAAEAKRIGYKEIAIVSTLSESMRSVRDSFLRYSRIPQVLNEEVLPGESDFQAISTKIRRLNPAAVFLCTMSPQGGLIARKLRDLGYKGAFFAAHPLEIEPEFAKPNSSLAGAWFVSQAESADSVFAQKYFAKFKHLPRVGAANGYDVANLLIAAFQKENVTEFLTTVRDFDGALGKYGSTSDHGFSIPAVVRRVNSKE